MNFRRIIWILIAVSVLLPHCSQKQRLEGNQVTGEIKSEPANWAERLGYPGGKKIIMLHSDDAGMCEEANIATQEYLIKGHIQSAAAMPPCPAFEDMIEWAKAHPDMDVGLHLTHTSEWKTYRWTSVTPSEEVPGLIDEEGMLWRRVIDVAKNASAEEVEKEIRAQIEKSLAMGYRPDHIDTHMGTLYARPDYAKAFLKVAMEYGIPANAIDLSDPDVVAVFKQQGYPINEEMIGFMESYTLPKLDFFTSAPKADTYEEKKAVFKKLIKSLKPGLTEIIFHPSVETEQLKSITGSWQQRVWEAKMFSDEDMIQFFKDEGLVFTNWKEIMQRFREMK